MFCDTDYSEVDNAKKVTLPPKRARPLATSTRDQRIIEPSHDMLVDGLDTKTIVDAFSGGRDPHE